MIAFTATRTPQTPDELWVCEHPPVFTLGLAGKASHLLADIGIPLIKVDRGGQITYHGPGQVVVYPICNLQGGREDVGLRKKIGLKAYRFSISWPRIIPAGRGAVNEKGVDFYRRLADALLAAGITPHATLLHWDSPQALEELYGSWRSREMAKDFAEYCSQTVRRLGDRITNWMTINEIYCFTYMGYDADQVPPHAPGTVVKSRQEVLQTVHHALLAHGMGCQAIRAASPKPASVSLVVNYDSYIPVIETPENIEAAKRAFVAEEHNGTVLVPALTGAYNPHTIEALGANAPDIQPGDMKIIAQPLDVLGFNIYTGSYVRAADNARGYEILPLPREYPQMHMPWLNFRPSRRRQQPARKKRRPPAKR